MSMKVKMNDEEVKENEEEVSEADAEGTESLQGDSEASSSAKADSAEDAESVAVEDLDPDEELWPGGPTAGQITQWKAEYGDIYVTSITYDKHVVWRTLSRAEYKNHMRNMEKMIQSGNLSQGESGLYNEEIITEICALYPPYSRANSVNEMAGLPSIIAQEVMEASGFQALEVRQL